ncbi:LuxR family transcriptional regulator [Plantactinospora endophytica]|uniref:LuxR family transcriptional regulator n=1 Tax=Plantactinospora endophytica TaxID=673535 RepID=UPI0023B2283C|nr:LuxR family transcriptional regulator [Plantactinospora endophytica]
MVDRNQYSDLLDAMFSDCVGGKGGVLVVAGAVATGKSILLQEFANRALESEALVLSANASRAERALPFETLAQVFQQLARSPHHRDEVNRLVSSEVAAMVIAGAPAHDIEREYARVFHDLWRMLSRETAQRPVVIVVDDVHHADESSLRGLLYLARRVKFANCLIVISEQVGLPHSQHPLLHAELFNQLHCRRIRLGPLTPAGVRDLLVSRGLAPEDVASDLATQCHALTGGNPLLVTGLLDDLAAAGASGALPAVQQFVNGAFGEAVISCMHRSVPEVQRIVTGAAILKMPTPERLAALLGLDEGTVQRCEPTLAGAGLTSDWCQRHPAIREAVLAQLSPRESGRLHIRAAELLRDEGMPSELSADHLLDAGVPLPGWAVPVLRSAAEDALADGRPKDAVRCLELARETTTDAAEHAAILARVTLIEWRENRLLVERRFPLLLEAVDAGQLGWADTAALVYLLLAHGRVGEGERVLERLAGRAAPAAVAETCGGLLRAWLVVTYPRLAAHLPAALVDGAATGAMPQQGPARAAIEICAAVQQGELDERCLHHAEHLLESCDLEDATLAPTVIALAALIYADRLDVAARCCDDLMHRAAVRGAVTWQAAFAAYRAEIALRQGDLALAMQHAQQALSSSDADGWGVIDGWAKSVLLLAATESGRLDRAGSVVLQRLPEAMLESRAGVHYLYARGRYFLARGRVHMALDDFRVCGELLTEWKLDLPGFVPWRLGVAEVHLRAGETEQARQLAQAQLDLARDVNPRVAGMALRLLAATVSRHTDRIRLLEEADVALSATRDLLHHAKVVMDLSRAYTRADALDAARLAETRARDMARQCELGDRGTAALAEPPWPAPGTARERVAPGETTILEDLSESERRVAALAAQGHTNRQIARRLFITVSTVEQHLTSTYRKLKVSRRADLPGSLTLVSVEG